jgi:hypothetical protein
MFIVFWPLVRLYAEIHCLLLHGASPVLYEHHGRSRLQCPVCGRIFWRSPRLA